MRHRATSIFLTLLAGSSRPLKYSKGGTYSLRKQKVKKQLLAAMALLTQALQLSSIFHLQGIFLYFVFVFLVPL